MKQRAFTLVELLVVISIIGLLSAVVLASVNGARDKARLARAIAFERNLHASLYDHLVAEYTFDELSGTLSAGTTVNDSGLNNYVGTTTGTVVVGEGVNSGKALSFSGTTGQSVDLGSSTAINTLSGAGFTTTPKEIVVSAWVKLNGNTQTLRPVISNARDCCSVYSGFNLWASFFAVNQPSFQIWDGTATYRHASTNQVLEVGKWYHLAGSYDGTTIKLYIDGILKASSNYSGNIGTPASFSTYIGRGGWADTYVMNGSIDNVRVYSRGYR